MNFKLSLPQSLHASKGHQLLTLIGFSFIFFEILFVGLYSGKFWFSLDIRWLGVPAILLVAIFARFYLKFLQSDRACRWLFWIWKGKPPIAYSRWIDLDDDGFTYGIRKIKWSAVDELFLTLLGNLELRSDAFSGAVFKLPFSIAAQEEQKAFIELAREKNPALRLNARLEKRINSPLVRGQNAVQLAGASFMALMLFDLGYSSFRYMEMLKHYYLSQTENDQMVTQLQEADEIRQHPLPFSWVSSRFLDVGASAARVSEARAHANLAIGDQAAALEDVRKASELAPENLTIDLLQVRILSDMGRKEEAMAAIKKAIEHHKNLLVPRLYLIANDRKTYQQMMDELKESTFNDEPRWPPGGNPFIRDLFYDEDIYYIFGPLMRS